MSQLQSLPTEFAITVANADVWLSIGLAVPLGAACWALGTWVARTVGLLERGAPAGETLGVGLASGLIVVAAWWAAIWSGGRSSFTPVAVGFAIALVLALMHRARPQGDQAGMKRPPDWGGEEGAESSRGSGSRSLILTALAATGFVIAVALLYGSTMAPSPREGVQPVENPDQAFYAVLGRDLAMTGTETNLSASGFVDLAGVPAQTWYHWAELWLASAVIAVFGAEPLPARNFIVLPIVLLAAAALTGTLVRRAAGTRSRRAYTFGFCVCLFLAPVPLIPGPFFSAWAFGLILGITLYGMAAVAVLLTIYAVMVLSTRTATWALGAFVGSTAAFIVPAHIVIAVLAVVGVGATLTLKSVGDVVARRRLLGLPPIWRRPFIATGIALTATVAMGLLTGHGLFTGHGVAGVGALPPGVSPFNASWRDSVAITALGAGLLLAIPCTWVFVRNEAPIEAALYLGTMVLLVFGAIAWGLRLGDFNSFYVFFGGIAVFATPLAAVASWRLLERLRARRHLRLAAGLVVLCVLQLGWGVLINGVPSLVKSGPLGDRQPIPVGLLGAISQLPVGAKLAYSCRPFEEATFSEPQLLSIDAHTGRRVVPLCFQADAVSPLIGGERSAESPSSSFHWAPQRVLYPDAGARPSSEDVAGFLKAHGIEYIYADAIHPNTLVENAVPIATSGGAEVLRVP